MEEVCRNCSYRYHDGFCTLNNYYCDGENSCGGWTDRDIELNKELVYRLCKQYIQCYDDLLETKDLFERYPDHQRSLKNAIENHKVFLRWSLNDLHREVSKWQTRR